MDVIVHFAMFFVFSAALYLDITKKRAKNFNRFSAIFIAIVISIGLGILTEFLQYLILPLNRSGSLGDLLSDLLGSVAGASLAAFIKRKSFVES
jgi:VanZ family protein